MVLKGRNYVILPTGAPDQKTYWLFRTNEDLFAKYPLVKLLLFYLTSLSLRANTMISRYNQDWIIVSN